MFWLKNECPRVKSQTFRNLNVYRSVINSDIATLPLLRFSFLLGEDWWTIWGTQTNCILQPTIDKAGDDTPKSSQSPVFFERRQTEWSCLFDFICPPSLVPVPSKAIITRAEVNPQDLERLLEEFHQFKADTAAELLRQNYVRFQQEQRRKMLGRLEGGAQTDTDKVGGCPQWTYRIHRRCKAR